MNENNVLIKKGKKRLEWAKTHMPVLSEIRERMIKEKSLENIKIGMALHVEAKTGVLALTLKEAGAEVRLAGCNPLSTDDSVAMALNDMGLETFAKKGETESEYYRNLNKVADLKPNLIIDDGCDLIFLVHTKRKEVLSNVKGANEETTTGVVRLKAMEKDRALKFPVIAVNNAYMKYLFDNRYGTGQSTMDGIMTGTNLLISGKKFVVAGYGWCGRGIAMRARGMGANVAVTEIDPIKAVEAKLDGFDVMPMMEACKNADFIVSSTGCKNVISEKHLEVIKDGCVLANSGHFDCEISKEALDKNSISRKKVREYVDEYKLKNGKSVYLLGEARLVNLSVGQGHPVEIMDMSFSAQALCAEYLVKNSQNMENRVYDVPPEIDSEIAKDELRAMNVEIDELTKDQKEYLSSWRTGT
jgi:adenosylhomocysteinase